MTREEILNSIPLKKRFCKDNSIPITVFDNPYFLERLHTFNYTEDVVDKFETFCSELSQFQSEQDYFEYYNRTKDAMIQYVRSSSAYEEFITLNFKTDSIVPKKNLYSAHNDKRLFISIDMKKVNFSALSHFSDNIFDGQKTWEEFVRLFTGMDHIVNSKYIRQVILGACNPKKQIQYEHYLMNILCKHLKDAMPGLSIYSLGEDEILIDVWDSVSFCLNDIRNAVNLCPDNIGSLVKINLFTLEKITGTDGWMKCHNNGKVEFKCLDSDIYLQVYKHYHDLPITNSDLVFFHNGRLARFLEEVEDPWR